MREFVRPKVVVSRCLGFDHCRYNGNIINSSIVANLMEYVDFLPVCPEVEIGLGIPRDPLRIILENGEQRLVQSASGRDGFILKYRSPSCGIKDVKIYPTTSLKSVVIGKTSGYFGRAVLKEFSYLPVEDEGRLRNARIKEHFMTRIFMLAAFRKVKSEGRMRDLVAFHSENKYLLMVYSQEELKKLGAIVANKDRETFQELVSEYEKHLYSALSRPPRYTSFINVLMHAFGHFSERLSNQEKALFFGWIQKYRNGKVSLCPAISIIRSWAVRFEDQYLMNQTFFEPYPEGLMEVDPIDSHLREDLWK